MLFSEPAFLFLFLPSLLWAYWLSPTVLKNLVLVLASLFFYAWGETDFVLVMVGSIVFNYVAGLAIQHNDGHAARKKIAFITGLTGNLCILGAFKYANFLVDNLNSALIVFSLGTVEIGSVRLPLGISFFTFQSMSYIFDVYRGGVTAQ